VTVRPIVAVPTVSNDAGRWHRELQRRQEELDRQRREPEKQS
jgi:hypothetical protein